MFTRLKVWLETIRIDDPLQRRLALAAQVFLLGLLFASVVALPLIFDAASSGEALLDTLAIATLAAGAGGGLFLLRRGFLSVAIVVSVAGFLIAIGNLLLRDGVSNNPTLTFTAAVPLVMAGLLLGRRGRIGFALVIAALLCGIMLTDELRLGSESVSKTEDVVLFPLVILVLMLFLDRISSVLHGALDEAHARAGELERLQMGLEETVAARTAELQASVDRLQTSQATIRELGSPVLPVLPGVLVAPLIGALDTARAADLSSTVLAAISRHRARHLILDITGVPVVDTHVARALLRVAEAARLLGAEPLLVGVRAEVAQTMVTLGVELGAVRVYPNLQEAIAAQLRAG